MIQYKETILIYNKYKVWNDKHLQVIESCRQSLKDLRLDYLDAYFVHWPFRNYHAPYAKPEDRNPDSKPFSVDEFIETWRQMEELYELGLVRNLGMSNTTIAKLKAVLPHCRVKPTLLQAEMHPSFQQQELYDYCLNNGIQIIAFSPIGSPERDRTPEDVSDIDMPIIKQIAEDHGVHPAVVCVKWAVQRGRFLFHFLCIVIIILVT